MSKLAVSPLWPMLGVMFGGAWLSWSWFALNSFAIGSASRKREIWLIAFGLALTSGSLAARSSPPSYARSGVLSRLASGTSHAESVAAGAIDRSVSRTRTPRAPIASLESR